MSCGCDSENFPTPPSGLGLLTWGVENIGAAADTRYLPPGHDPGFAPLADVMQMPLAIQTTGTLQNLYVRHNSAGGNGQDVVYDVLVNGAATGITVTLASGAVGQGSDITNTFAVVAGDRVSLQVSKAIAIADGAVDVQASLQVVG